MLNFRDWISYRLGSSLVSARPFAISGADHGASEGHGEALPSLPYELYNNPFFHSFRLLSGRIKLLVMLGP